MLCKICHKKYNTKSLLKRHLSAHLNKCQNQNQSLVVQREIEVINNAPIIKNVACELCGGKYVDKYSLQNHQRKTCIFPNIKNLIKRGIKKLSIDQRNELINLLTDEKTISIQTNYIDNSGQTINNSNIINNGNIINNDNRTINIQVVNVGEENLQMIKSKDFLDQVLTHIEDNTDYYNEIKEEALKDILVETYRKVNCNPDYPENHNLYKGNKSPYTPFHIKVDNKWIQSTDLNYIRKIIKDKKEQVKRGLGSLGDIENHEKIIDAYVGLDKYLVFQEDIPKKICHEILQLANEHKGTIKKTYELDK